MKRLAHSYARFSSAKQIDGDSERRQIAAAKSFCERRRFTLSDLRWIDRARSGWSGDKQAALKALLTAIDDGSIKRGDTLVVEAIDRLSRKGIRQTQTLINAILDAGIDIAILTPVEQVYQASESNDIGAAVQIAAFAFGAHTYSANLSMRVRSACEQARKAAYAGQRIKGICPSWLENRGGKFKVKADALPAIKFIFRRIIEGTSLRCVVKDCHEKYQPLNHRKNTAGTWNLQFIRNLLTDRKLLGEYQPHKMAEDGTRKPVGELIPDYFPRVIEEKTFSQAGAAVGNRRCEKTAGRGYVNLFVGLVWNAEDKSPMRTQTTTRANKDGRRITERRLTSKAASLLLPNASHAMLRIEEFETAILKHLAELDLSVFDAGKQSAALDLAALRAQLDGKNTRLIQLQEQMAEDGDLALIAPAVRRLRDDIKALTAAVDAAKQRAANPISESLDLLQSLDRASEGNRIKLRQALKLVVNRIDLLPIKMGDNRNSPVAWWADLTLCNGGHRLLLIYRGQSDTHLDLAGGPRTDKRLADYDAEDCAIHANLIRGWLNT
jgi:DNA invertase Pin-like site-specific DNA recombinase